MTGSHSGSGSARVWHLVARPIVESIPPAAALIRRRDASSDAARRRSHIDTEGERAMKLLTTLEKKTCCPEKAAQCCAKASRLVSGCHD
jgi:hypothetical protein